jgi:S-adenosylmethionine:tRNA ribosyltransferase-isomerase
LSTVQTLQPSVPAVDERSSSAYDYELPQHLIAQHPAPRRDASRLMVLEGDATTHCSFRDLPRLLQPGDVLVLNETRVIAARLVGELASSRRQVELLLLHPTGSVRYDADAVRWVALARPARRLRKGERIIFCELGHATVLCELERGARELEFTLPMRFEQFLAQVGRMPLPPYIHNRSEDANERYQSVFARVPGSVAAPTASLHFTQQLLAQVERRGVEIARLTLDVGLGTFRPVTAEYIDEHVMPAEAYAIAPSAADAIERARREQRRIVAVGTTVVRALEGNLRSHGRLTAGEFTTDLFITAGFSFAVVDAIITNFHLPRSSLLMLVSAFAGRERILRAYAEAIERDYRFYSFGDAMLIAGRKG